MSSPNPRLQPNSGWHNDGTMIRATTHEAHTQKNVVVVEVVVRWAQACAQNKEAASQKGLEAAEKCSPDFQT